jgi:hypothetical protein
MSQQQWTLFGAAITGFAIAVSIQAWYVNRVMKRMFEMEAQLSTVEDWSKLTRQDVAGLLVSLGVTNGLLGTILAVLIFR